MINTSKTLNAFLDLRGLTSSEKVSTSMYLKSNPSATPTSNATSPLWVPERLAILRTCVTVYPFRSRSTSTIIRCKRVFEVLCLIFTVPCIIIEGKFTNLPKEDSGCFLFLLICRYYSLLRFFYFKWSVKDFHDFRSNQSPHSIRFHGLFFGRAEHLRTGPSFFNIFSVNIWSTHGNPVTSYNWSFFILFVLGRCLISTFS